MIMQLRREADNYSGELLRFSRNTAGFHSNFLTSNVDHVGISAASSNDFSRMVKQVQRFARRVTLHEIGGRYIAIARVFLPIEIRPLWSAEFVEIMEPDSKQAGPGGFEHVAFPHRDLGDAQRELGSLGVESTYLAEPGRSSLDIRINEAGQSVRLITVGTEEFERERLSRDEGWVVKLGEDFSTITAESQGRL